MFICVCVLQVVACPFLREKRRNNMTTVLLPCQVFFRSSQPTGSPQAMEVSIQALSLKVAGAPCWPEELLTALNTL